MLDLGSASFIMSPAAAKAFAIPVIKRTEQVTLNNVTGQKIPTDRLFTLPLSLLFWNHRSFNEDDHAFKVMKTYGDYDALIPGWYLDKHKARGTTMCHLHFAPCSLQCYGLGKIHPEYSMTYDKRVSLNKKAIHIGAIIMSNSTEAQKLPTHYHSFALQSIPKESEKLPDNQWYDHWIGLIGAKNKLRMGPVHQLSQEEEK